MEVITTKILTKNSIPTIFSLPTDIQQEGIPAILGGGDVLMVSSNQRLQKSFKLFRLQKLDQARLGLFACQSFKSFGRQCATFKWASTRNQKVDLNLEFQSILARFLVKQGWRMSIFDKDTNLGLSGDGLTCQSTHPKAWSGIRSSMGVVGKGKSIKEEIVNNSLLF